MKLCTLVENNTVHLSERETRILLYFSRGYRSKEFDYELNVSLKTTENAKRSIISKLRINSIDQAIILAHYLKWFSNDTVDMCQGVPYRPDLQNAITLEYDRLSRGLTPSIEELSGRERTALANAARGYDRRETASNMGISPKTIDSHKAMVLRVLGVTRTTQAVIMGYNFGWWKNNHDYMKDAPNFHEQITQFLNSSISRIDYP